MKKIKLILFLLAIWFAYQTFFAGPSVSSERQLTSFTIEKGEGVATIADNLEQDNIIDSAFWFNWYYRIFSDAPFYAGDHELSTGSSYSDVIRVLSTRPAVAEEITLTFVEGWTLEDMGAYLQGEGVTNLSDFMAYVENPTEELLSRHARLLADLPKGATLEGYLAPNTYRFFANIQVHDIVDKLLLQMDKKLNELGAYDTSKNIHELVILASMVEKEVRTAPDRPIVAGLFQNRIDINMPLQADSTINYVTKSGRARSTYDDLEIDNPYNTYKYVGFPPGPISNPGLAAVEAAFEPADTDYLFFLTDPQGKVYYAETFEGHVANRVYLD